MKKSDKEKAEYHYKSAIFFATLLTGIIIIGTLFTTFLTLNYNSEVETDKNEDDGTYRNLSDAFNSNFYIIAFFISLAIISLEFALSNYGKYCDMYDNKKPNEADKFVKRIIVLIIAIITILFSIELLIVILIILIIFIITHYAPQLLKKLKQFNFSRK